MGGDFLKKNSNIFVKKKDAPLFVHSDTSTRTIRHLIILDCDEKHHDGARLRVLCVCKCVATGWKNDKRCGILSYMRVNRKRGY